MQVTFYGAAREVTGSMHLVATEHDRILLDCGMFQGRRRESDLKNRTLPVDPRIITTVVLSHAHLDHSGRIPLLTERNFTGHVICTRATADACEYLLPDSAKIQESDAAYLNYKTVRSLLYTMKTSPRTRTVSNRQVREIRKLLKKGRNEINEETVDRLIQEYRLEGVQPLYTMEQAQRSLGFFEGYPYRHPVVNGRDMTCTFYDAGHILGSAVSVVRAGENGRRYTVAYTGDLGRFGKPILEDPTLDFAEEDREVDLLILESTYGARHHQPVESLREQLREALAHTLSRGGTVLIPSFAFGRTQEIVYVLHELYANRELPRVPVYVDSPLASRLTRVFGEHPELYDRQTHRTFLERGKNPFSFEQVRFVETVDESMALMREDKPHIVIAASGMCEGGRILHHLRYKVHNERNTILVVGYMAENTLGRRIVEKSREYEAAGRGGPAPLIRFLNKEYPLRARVVELEGFSAHADQGEILHFLRNANLCIKRIALVHGEESQALGLAERLRKEGYAVVVPHLGQVVALH